MECTHREKDLRRRSFLYKNINEFLKHINFTNVFQVFITSSSFTTLNKEGKILLVLTKWFYRLI